MMQVLNKKTISYKGKTYFIDNSKEVGCIGDFNEAKGKILIDKNMPEKFYEGIVVHEIEERNLIKKGLSYVDSHNKAQEIEKNSMKKNLARAMG